MARKKKTKLIVAGVIAASLIITGTGYAKWSREQRVKTSVHTDTFRFGFGERGYIAEIVDESGTVHGGVDFTVNTLEDNTRASFVFSSGIPASLLQEDKYIRISYPIENTKTSEELLVKTQSPQLLDGSGKKKEIVSQESSIVLEGLKLLTNQPDFSKEADEKITLTAKQGYIAMAGEAYIYENIPEEFMQPVIMDVYRSVAKEGDAYYGYLYLRLSEESREKLALLPAEVTVEKRIEEFELTDMSTDREGIMIRYEGEASVVLEQANAEEMEASQ